jgi:hypothetical protein
MYSKTLELLVRLGGGGNEKKEDFKGREEEEGA